VGSYKAIRAREARSCHRIVHMKSGEVVSLSSLKKMIAI